MTTHDISTSSARVLFDKIRDQYELCSSHFKTASCYENFKPFKILVAFPRQATSYGELRRVVYDNRRHMPSSLRVATSSPKKWTELNS